MKNKKLPPKEVCAPFVIDNKPYCFWDADMPETNLRFINQIDSEYFEYVANVNFNIFQNEDENLIDKKTRQHAAVALRIAYSQGLEALFSLIFATIQAPHCVIGWMLKYTNKNLFEVVRKFGDYHNILVYPAFNIKNWRDFTDLIFTYINEEDKRNLDSEFENFSRLWSWFAQDFLDKSFNDEYNSLKHGLRVYMGGFHLMMGLQQEYGIPAPMENMKTVAYSEFGTTYFTAEKIEESSNFLVHMNSRNWSPENYFHGLNFISGSIKNILIFLKKFNGENNQFEYLIPTENEFYLKPWKLVSNQSIGHNSTIKVKKEGILSKEDILSFYKRDEKEN